MSEKKQPCCLPKVREQYINENPSVTSVFFELSNIQNIERSSSAKTGQQATVFYNHEMKNGEIREKKIKTFFTHNFCPFCGKKYS